MSTTHQLKQSTPKIMITLSNKSQQTSLMIDKKNTKLNVRDLRKLPKDKQESIVKQHASLGAKHFEFEEDTDNLYTKE